MNIEICYIWLAIPEVIGRPLNSVSVHPHVEFLIMEAVLKHPEKTLAEIAQDV